MTHISMISMFIRPFVVWFLVVHGATAISFEIFKPLALPVFMVFLIDMTVGVLATILFWGLVNEIVELTELSKEEKK
jgi:hypothetical protein